MNKEKIINDIEDIINSDKECFYNVVCDIKSGHFDFPPEVIYEQLDLLFDEIKRKIEEN